MGAGNEPIPRLRLPTLAILTNPSSPHEPHMPRARRTPMCSLTEHTARSHREHLAKQTEPIYTQTANDHGIPYEPPTQGPQQGPSSFPCPETQGEQ